MSEIPKDCENCQKRGGRTGKYCTSCRTHLWNAVKFCDYSEEASREAVGRAEDAHDKAIYRTEMDRIEAYENQY